MRTGKEGGCKMGVAEIVIFVIAGIALVACVVFGIREEQAKKNKKKQ